MDLLLIGADSAGAFCMRSANVWQFVGWILMVFKIVIPILLIIFGMIDLGKAVIGSKEDEIKKATGSLVRRAIAAVVIFFIPTLVSIIFGLIDQTYIQEDGTICAKEDTCEIKAWDPCRNCVSNPAGEKCVKWASEVD